MPRKKIVPTKSAESNINPKHYVLTINGQPIEMVDIVEAFFAQDAHLAFAIQYIFRAGRKSSSSYVEDVSKAVWWLVRALMFSKVKNIELPPGAPIHIPEK